MSTAVTRKNKNQKKLKKTTTPIVKQPKILADEVRLRKKPKYKSFRLHKRVKHPAGPLPSWRVLTIKTVRLLVANKKNIFQFFIIYGVLYLVFVRGFSAPVDTDEIREAFESIGAEEVSSLATNFTVFGLIVQSTTNAGGDIAALYQLFLVMVSSLAFIWLFRQQQAGNAITMKDAFYKGMYPFIPFTLLVVLAGLQTIPATIGNFLFRTVTESGLAINTAEQTVWLLLMLLLFLLSLYLITSTIIALFIVTLPEMTPMLALKKAKELVTFRRFSVIRKVTALIAFVVFAYVILVFPVIFISSIAAQLVFFMLTLLMVPFAVGYLFVLYRELL